MAKRDPYDNPNIKAVNRAPGAVVTTPRNARGGRADPGDKTFGRRAGPLTPANDASIGAGPKPPRYGIGKPAISRKSGSVPGEGPAYPGSSAGHPRAAAGEGPAYPGSGAGHPRSGGPLAAYLKRTRNAR